LPQLSQCFPFLINQGIAVSPVFIPPIFDVHRIRIRIEQRPPEYFRILYPARPALPDLIEELRHHILGQVVRVARVHKIKKDEMP